MLGLSRAKKGWGRENTLRTQIAQRGGWRRPIDVAGAGRGAPGASRGRAGAERRKSSFLGRVYHSITNEIVQYLRVALLVL